MINLALLLTRTQNYVWVTVKLYNQHKNENQSPSVKNSHQCHYSRLWKYIHQISYRSHRRSVNVGGHLVYLKKKKTHIPCHYKSSISHPHSLFVSVSPTHCLFLTSHPLPTPLNLFQSYFQSFSLGLFYHSLSLCIAPLSCLFSRYTVVYKGGARGVWGYQSCYKTFFVEVGAVSFAFKWIGAGKRGGKRAIKWPKIEIDVLFINGCRERGWLQQGQLSNNVLFSVNEWKSGLSNLQHYSCLTKSSCCTCLSRKALWLIEFSEICTFSNRR